MNQPTNSLHDETTRRFNNAIRTPIGLAVSSLLLVVGGGWFGDALKGDCIRFFHPDGCEASRLVEPGDIAASLALFVIGAAGLTAGTRYYLPVRHLRMRRNAQGRKALVIAVSTPYLFSLSARGDQVICEKDPAACVGCNNSVKTEDGKSDCKTFAERRLTLTGDIGLDIQRLNGTQFNLQQFLRAIKPHVGQELEQVCLLGSPGDKGSARLLPSYEGLVRGYAPKARISIEPAVDFEEVDAMYRAINSAVERISDVQHLQEKDIVIDVTGGQKTASIAAALATLHRGKLEFQYVSVSGTNEVLTFNMVTESQEKLSG